MYKNMRTGLAPKTLWRRATAVDRFPLRGERPFSEDTFPVCQAKHGASLGIIASMMRFAIFQSPFVFRAHENVKDL